MYEFMALMVEEEKVEWEVVPDSMKPRVYLILKERGLEHLTGDYGKTAVITP